MNQAEWLFWKNISFLNRYFFNGFEKVYRPVLIFRLALMFYYLNEASFTNTFYNLIIKWNKKKLCIY